MKCPNIKCDHGKIHSEMTYYDYQLGRWVPYPDQKCLVCNGNGVIADRQELKEPALGLPDNWSGIIESINNRGKTNEV